MIEGITLNGKDLEFEKRIGDDRMNYKFSKLLIINKIKEGVLCQKVKL